MLDSLLAATLLSIAVSFSGLPAIPTPPVQIIDHHTLEVIVCDAKPCPVLGLTLPNGTVMVDAGLSMATAYGQSVVIHEMVHALQFAKLGPTTDCADMIRRERQAYIVQGRYMIQSGEFPTMVNNWQMLRCRE